MENSHSSENVDISMRDQIETKNLSSSEDQGFSETHQCEQQQQQLLNDTEEPMTIGGNDNGDQISDQLAEKWALFIWSSFS